MAKGNIVKVMVFAERPDYMPPAKSAESGLPEGFLIGADDDLDLKGALLRFIEQTGGCRPEFIDRIPDDKRKAFYASKITRAQPKDNWLMSPANGKLGIRYSILVEFEDRCYIATACFGDREANEVIFFRQFRDDVLQKSSAGRKFIQYYYRYSPVLADIVKTSRIARVVSRYLILKPLLSVLKLFRS